ncbi:MAG: competence/damage-inducible protein A [Alphaproteobacteria bacterium]|nr:competence/damage-inducible protein A [Alphaproteobacteria bacterium]
MTADEGHVPAMEITARIVVIGNEVLSGRTRDANINFLAREMTALGIRLVEARVVRDIEHEIVRAIDESRAAATYVFTTGGIGPTHDDITAAAVAKAFGVELLLDERALACLRRQYSDPADLNPARLRMARIPAGAELIENPVSNAPGFRIGNVFVMAGVPRIMQAMFDGVRPLLRTGRPMLSRTLTVHCPEGRIAGPLAEAQDAHPAVEIGSYPFIREDRLGVAVVLRATEPGQLAEAAADLRARLAPLSTALIEDDGAPCL